MKSNAFRYSFKVWLSSLLLVILLFQLFAAGMMGARSDEISFVKLMLIPLPFAFFHSTIFCLGVWGFLSLKQTATRGWQIKMVLSMFLIVFWLFSWLALGDQYTQLIHFTINLRPPEIMKDFPPPYMLIEVAGLFALVVMLVCIWVFRVREANIAETHK